MSKIVKKLILGLATIIGCNFNLIQAGAVLNGYRIDLPNGKRIIMFGEQHQGEIDFTESTFQNGIPVPAEQIPIASVHVELVEQNQNRALATLFSADVAPLRDAVATYIECNDDLCAALKAGLIENFQSGDIKQIDQDINRSWFDHYYRIFFAMGSQATNAVASLRNFDGRATINLALEFCAIRLSTIVDKYIRRDCDDTYLERAKQKFFDSDDYHAFKEYEHGWLNAIVQPIMAAGIRLQTKTPAHTAQKIFDDFHEKRAKLELLALKADFAKQDIFEFLFGILEVSKKEFPQLLSSLCGIASTRANPVDTLVWDALELSAMIPDLNLMEKVIDDPRPIVLVHGGDAHLARVYEYFQTMHSQGVRTRPVVSFIRYPLMNNQATYHLMRNLIFS